ncbi:hypothetical protein MAPG_11280 [Magnaporthiopsis poae ATCC 64411]|uniref:Uncharacterized protein n=1 Tax=Magnaporthiopsis poae (strain ATCC 64411 / 73-15) TaxID=644358 RepID=A0A0C4EEU9_MAGP6|nr:hypothetical protein MAPG_11280 [Magnaporthiopsis poae ATCC 64411]
MTLTHGLILGAQLTTRHSLRWTLQKMKAQNQQPNAPGLAIPRSRPEMPGSDQFLGPQGTPSKLDLLSAPTAIAESIAGLLQKTQPRTSVCGTAQKNGRSRRRLAFCPLPALSHPKISSTHISSSVLGYTGRGVTLPCARHRGRQPAEPPRFLASFGGSLEECMPLAGPLPRPSWAAGLGLMRARPAANC